MPVPNRFGVLLFFPALLGIGNIISQTTNASSVSVDQLEHFLMSKRATKQNDTAIADTLNAVTLTEQLTLSTLDRINSETSLGPKSVEALDLLAAESTFRVPPSGELPVAPVPESAAEQKMIGLVSSYVNNVLLHLPDFLATRNTVSFDDTPVSSGLNRSKVQVRMHFVGSSRREITFRGGREVNVSGTPASRAPFDIASAPDGLTTWGEFGPILEMVLSDSFKGSLTWSRWQKNDRGAKVAVFRYLIPRSSSHYSIDFCCYQKSEEEPAMVQFHDKTGYHGEISIDPITGTVDRITLEAELSAGDPVLVSDIEVQYGSVEIDGKRYTCPLKGIAFSAIRVFAGTLDEGTAIEKHLNEVSFRNYHKFASTTHILAEPSDNAP